MNNLFGIFDPVSSVFSLSLNWLIVLLLFMWIPVKFWIGFSPKNYLILNLVLSVNTEFKSLLATFSNKSMNLMILSLLMIIMISNFLGLIPYVFTSTSHLVCSMSLAIPLWLGHYVYSWVIQPHSMLVHLTPKGTPYALMPFMVLIELLSSLIRPLTLSVRLVANMVAGHLMLTLMSVKGYYMLFNNKIFILMLVFLSIIGITVLETAVAGIQSYVFSVLSLLYLNEVNSLKISTY